jgi:hypothetical protein
MKDSYQVVIEGVFGKVAVNVKAPGITELWLREADGNLAAKNVLSLHPPMHDWAVGGYSYVVDVAGNRYESRRSSGHRIEQKDGKLALRGVKLVDAEGKAAQQTPSRHTAPV